MLVTRFWFNYLVTCHKGLTQLLVICYTVVTKFWFNYWLLATRLQQSCHDVLVQLLVICHNATKFITSFGSIIDYLPQGCHNVCHTVLVQLFVICHKAATKFVTRFWFNYWLLVARLSQGFVELLVICHKVVTMFVTIFGFNYWLLATRLPQCLPQGFHLIINYLSQGCHKVCHKVLVQLLVICHKLATNCVTKFWFNYWLFATRLPQCLPQGLSHSFGSIIGYLSQGYHQTTSKHSNSQPEYWLPDNGYP